MSDARPTHRQDTDARRLAELALGLLLVLAGLLVLLVA